MRINNNNNNDGGGGGGGGGDKITSFSFENNEPRFWQERALAVMTVLFVSLISIPYSMKQGAVSVQRCLSLPK